MSKKQPWNSLEIAKLSVSATTPILLLVLGLFANQWVSQTELAVRERSAAADAAATRQAAVQDFSTFIYERRVRAELLSSALKRRAALTEVIERKKLYDEAYVRWNTSHQANLLLIRQLLGEQRYTSFEGLIEFHLVGNIFRPLDRCLTDAYDLRIAGDDPLELLRECDATGLIQLALDCGFALTEELFKITGSLDLAERGGNVAVGNSSASKRSSEREIASARATSVVDERCRLANQGR